MTPIYEKQHRTAQWLVNQSLSTALGNDAVTHLTGAVGSGRTSVLRLASEEVKRKGFIPIFLRTSAAEIETGAIVLSEAIDCIASDDLSHEESGSLRDPHVKWSEKFDLVRRKIDQHAEKYVILCDEPARWFRSGVSEIEDTPDHYAKQLSKWVFERSKCRRIVTGAVPSGLPSFESAGIPKVDDGQFLLNQSEMWESAADLARQIAHSASRSINYRSVMEIRLAVAWAWLFSPKEATRQLRSEASVPTLLETLLDSIEERAPDSERWRYFCTALARMALARTEIKLPVCDRLAADLSEPDRDILRICFCEEWPGSVSLHPLVRYEVLRRARDRRHPQNQQLWRLPEEQRIHTHECLYESANHVSPGRSYRNDLEVLHHGALSGKLIDLESDVRLHFVEQLQQIGRYLSYDHREHRPAAEVFRLSLKFDEENAYSHHYLAFNLDWNAEERDQVETHYQEAIRLQPDHPWWRSRWISYLATRGRNKEAKIAWRQAVDDLSVAEDTSPDWIYLSLHRWVARWMLHWGNLGLADDILKSIPPDLASDASISRLNRLLQSLRLAEQGIAVFPLSITPDRWWTPSGHTGLPIELEGCRLSAWYPARVEMLDDDRFAYLALGIPTGSGPTDVEVEEYRLDRALVDQLAVDFAWNDLAVGRFLELGHYGEFGLKRIGMHRATELVDPDLLPLVPPPDRWFRKTMEASWNDLQSGAR